MTAPSYSPSVTTIQTVKNSQAAPVSVAKATVASANLNKISLRSNPLKSPYGDYAAYIEQALKTELSQAGLLDDNATTVISSKLTQNSLDTGMSTGTGEIAAVFTVTKAGTAVFQKEISATETWQSSFVGAIAIPNAVNAYPALVNKLIANLFSDKEFLASIAK